MLFPFIDLNKFRGGCIVCMDYTYYSMNPNYFLLVTQFDGITEVLTNKLRQFQRLNFDPNNTFLFGFSYGAQMALEAGRRFGPRTIQSIDGK